MKDVKTLRLNYKQRQAEIQQSRRVFASGWRRSVVFGPRMTQSTRVWRRCRRGREA